MDLPGLVRRAEVLGVRLDGVLADDDVEHAVRAEEDPSTVVEGARGGIEDDLAGDPDTVRDGDLEDLVAVRAPNPTGGVRVQVGRGGVVRVQRHAQQALFAGALHVADSEDERVAVRLEIAAVDLTGEALGVPDVGVVGRDEERSRPADPGDDRDRVRRSVTAGEHAPGQDDSRDGWNDATDDSSVHCQSQTDHGTPMLSRPHGAVAG